MESPCYTYVLEERIVQGYSREHDRIPDFPSALFLPHDLCYTGTSTSRLVLCKAGCWQLKGLIQHTCCGAERESKVNHKQSPASSGLHLLLFQIRRTEQLGWDDCMATINGRLMSLVT
jgi:hypothetical protein